MTVQLPPLRCLVVPWDSVFSHTTPLHVFTIDRPSAQDYEEWIADLVGGPFERVPGPADSQFCCKTHAVHLGLRENIIITALAHDAELLSVAEYIAGQVVVVGPADEHGNDTSVPDVLLNRLRDLHCLVED